MLSLKSITACMTSREQGIRMRANLESELAEPLTTVSGYETAQSKFGAEAIKTEPGKSAHGYDIEDNSRGAGRAGVSPVSTSGNAEGTAAAATTGSTITTKTTTTIAAGAAPHTTTTTNSSDFADDARRVPTTRSLDPRSHWSANDVAAERYDEVPDQMTSTGKPDPRQRPDSGISMPDRYNSPCKASLDESVSRSVKKNGSQATPRTFQTVDSDKYDEGARGSAKAEEAMGDEVSGGALDPAVMGSQHPKMTGMGEPGSHSAVFGLTPDGKKHDDTASSISSFSR